MKRLHWHKGILALDRLHAATAAAAAAAAAALHFLPFACAIVGGEFAVSGIVDAVEYYGEQMRGLCGFVVTVLTKWHSGLPGMLLLLLITRLLTAIGAPLWAMRSQ